MVRAATAATATTTAVAATAAVTERTRNNTGGSWIRSATAATRRCGSPPRTPTSCSRLTRGWSTASAGRCSATPTTPTTQRRERSSPRTGRCSREDRVRDAGRLARNDRAQRVHGARPRTYAGAAAAARRPDVGHSDGPESELEATGSRRRAPEVRSRPCPRSSVRPSYSGISTACTTPRLARRSGSRSRRSSALLFRARRKPARQPQAAREWRVGGTGRRA